MSFFSIEIALPRGIDTRTFQRFFVLLLRLRLVFRGAAGQFPYLFFKRRPGVLIHINGDAVFVFINAVNHARIVIATKNNVKLVAALGFFCVKLLFSFYYRYLPCFNIHCADRKEAHYVRTIGNIGAGSVLYAAVGKGSLKTVAAFAACQCAVDLGGTLLGLHVQRQNIIVAADDAAGQIVFQVADGHSTASTHVCT